MKIRQRTYLIDEGTIQRVDKLADRLHVHKGELVRYLLKRSLGLVDSGEWKIATCPAFENIIQDEGRKA